MSGYQTTPFQFQCPPNAYVDKIMVRSGTLIDAIQVMCTDGSTSAIAGGTEGTPGEQVSPSGFNSVEMITGDYTDFLRFNDDKDTAFGTADSNRDPNPTKKHSVTVCKDGGLITGIKGASGNWLDNIEFVCGKAWAPLPPAKRRIDPGVIVPGMRPIVPAEDQVNWLFWGAVILGVVAIGYVVSSKKMKNKLKL